MKTIDAVRQGIIFTMDIQPHMFDKVEPNTPLSAFGMDSLDAMEMLLEIEDLLDRKIELELGEDAVLGLSVGELADKIDGG